MRHNGDEGISMKKRVLTAATVVMLLGTLGPGVASSAPTPIYEVSCAVGSSGQTNVNWKRAKLATVTLQWVAPAGSAVIYQDLVVPITWNRPSGFVVTSTPSVEGVAPASAIVLFQHARGSGVDRVEVPCA